MTGTSDDSQPRIVHDCVESVGYCQNRATGKLFANGRLDETIRLQVDGRSRLVQHQDLRLAQNGSCQTDQLAMANARSRWGQVLGLTKYMNDHAQNIITTLYLFYAH